VIDDVSILTIADFSTLKRLEEVWSARGHDLTPALRRKLHRATVTFQSDLPRGIATLGSRISYSIGDEGMLTRTLTATTGLDAQWLPVSLPLGLALLGQCEGIATIVDCDGEAGRRVKLHRVLDQPEASWPGRFNTAAGECAHRGYTAPGVIDRPVVQASRPSHAHEDSDPAS
jgi:regulator of nucleoside diphosphate kinase